ncbi:hypothetical protein BKA82DRAFT_26206 [Pisolithus tinctorius]|uniref:Uncharacterized protein n=1 Tax=Pisolithus tinctorius Marx 270 TaxID=870435 RepID=A0A0C3P9A2_PISTI|nr:hypothetical protein BKA82DRAFT_26206 [Pisolithus tinctorius]KIO04356.1 hypothetical protein M404DRAFT_26206 [Pisolithus tinctorius Marx 270]
MLSNHNSSPPNAGIPAHDLTCTASILQLLLGWSQGDTKLRNMLLASLMGPLLAPGVSKPQIIISPVLPDNNPPIGHDIHNETVPAANAALVDNNPTEPTPGTNVIQEPVPNPALDLPSFNTLPDVPLSTSTSTVTPSCTLSPSLPSSLYPPSPLMPTVSPNQPTTVQDAPMPADPTTPPHQTLDISEPGPDCLPADSPLTGHTSLDCPLLDLDSFHPSLSLS